MSRNISSLVAVVVSVLLLTGCSSFTDRQPDPPGTPTATAAEFPDGFTDRGNGVASRFVEEENCGQARCSQVEIYAYGSCPKGVYVRADTLDESGAVIGFSNGIAGALSTGDTSIATLPIHEDTATDVKITEVTCH